MNEVDLMILSGGLKSGDELEYSFGGKIWRKGYYVEDSVDKRTGKVFVLIERPEKEEGLTVFPKYVTLETRQLRLSTKTESNNPNTAFKAQRRAYEAEKGQDQEEQKDSNPAVKWRNSYERGEMLRYIGDKGKKNPL